MKRCIPIIILFFNLFLFSSCYEPQPPVIRLGKSFDYQKQEISGSEADAFNYYDNIFYMLSQETPFPFETITLCIYKGSVYIDLVRKECEDIKPGRVKKIDGIIKARNIAGRYGAGDYMMLFIVQDTVIAKKAFKIQGSVREQIKTEQPAESKPVKKYDELVPNQKPDILRPISPSEMMNP